MRKTPQDFKRVEVRQIITKVLGDTQTRLLPISITVGESLDDDFTTTDFSFEIAGKDHEIVTLKNQKGKGFMDGLFTGLQQYFSNNYSSLAKIKLADYNVNPIMTNSKKSMGTDAQASVSLSVMVHPHGLSEFSHTSRSMIHSSFSAALEAFQFYVNCEKAFHRIQLFIEDAQQRNRGDVISVCIYDLSKLTEVNTYERKEES
tara:strand:+ start:1435 stop:2043 length:609 start_codon:yes stop_codon:yes gene_type:complete